MKFSEFWLREWCNPSITRDELCHQLTMAGLEVEAVTPVAGHFSGVVVGAIIHIEPHPSADKLHCCLVDIGKKKPLSIVTGARNIFEGMKVAVALSGGELANGQVIKSTEIRGVQSNGMLCSAAELGLSDERDVMMQLAEDAPIGTSLGVYLGLDDYVIDLSITPNRGDCLSVRGVAREVSVITKTRLKQPRVSTSKSSSKITFPIRIRHKAGCPRYVGRVIKGVCVDGPSPVWLQEKLRRSGIRSINPVVDVTNYVMLELGQPMHAFDLGAIQGEIQVRKSIAGERIVLLDGSEHELDADTMVIADKQGPLAMAGVMGGRDSGVTARTTDIFLESAYFDPKTIARQRQHYLLNSDSAYRFERGVDPAIQREAMLRATQLILTLCGGEAGAVMEVSDAVRLKKPVTISLTQDKLNRVLGMMIPPRQVEAIFKSFQFSYRHLKNAWVVKVPSYRPDLVLPEDLIEEIARVYGYDRLPGRPLRGELTAQVATEQGERSDAMRDVLCDLGYQEVITYSFIDEKMSELFDPCGTFCSLINPITADMVRMRSTLWPGLFQVLQYNQSRQQQRCRFFEMGTCFTRETGSVLHTDRLAGLITGTALPEQWGVSTKLADFFDLKGDICSLVERLGLSGELTFQPITHTALHPRQAAAICLSGKKIGIMGALHPAIQQKIDQKKGVFIFEMDIEPLCAVRSMTAVLPAKFPEIRRDLSILIKQTVPFEAISYTIRTSAGDWLKDVFVFDVYQGKGISPDLKSVALGVILQHPTRTLVESEITAIMETLTVALKDRLGAELRS